jgi:hypothetical protein
MKTFRNFLIHVLLYAQDNQVHSIGDFLMLKSAILASAVCFAFIVPASAQNAAVCDDASLTAMRTQIDSMSDKEKQKIALGNWEAANTAFKSNNVKDCNDRFAEASKSLGDAGAGGEPATGGVDNNGSSDTPANTPEGGVDNGGSNDTSGAGTSN